MKTSVAVAISLILLNPAYAATGPAQDSKSLAALTSAAPKQGALKGSATPPAKGGCFQDPKGGPIYFGNVALAGVNMAPPADTVPVPCPVFKGARA